MPGAAIAPVVAPMITPAIATIISAGIGLFSSSRTRRDARRRSAEALKRQQEQQAKLDEEIEKYRAIQFENPYQNIENPFEDLTVNQQAAQFQAQQIQQQQANLLEGFKGAAGSSGIGGLAQILANQGALQTQKASASIAQQEQANQKAAASADLRIQQLQGAGDAMVQQAQSSRQATILGMNQSVMAGVNANYQRQQLNQQYANAQANKLAISSLSQLATLDLENLGGTNSVGKNVPDLDMDGIPDFIDAPQPSTIGPKLPQ
tara:strand:+ start:100 stop:888 length:789 start_codon:yes stop_codon:yes gene_type:complete